jgi:hypothetical protein
MPYQIREKRVPMFLKSEPIDIFAQIQKNFHSTEQFDELVRASALYYQEHGDLNLLKLFIPNGNKIEEETSLLNKWTPEKAEQAANDVILILTEKRICNAYVKETHEDGVYLAFKTETSTFLSFSEYLSEASYIISKARRNKINLTADEWLKDFPYEFHAAWYNRNAASEEIAVWLREPGNELFAKALYDGQQNWLENEKYSKIENWEPKGKFTKVFDWDDTPEEKNEILAKFRREYN